MRYLPTILLIPALLLAISAATRADSMPPLLTDFHAEIQVMVTGDGGVPLEGAVVRLDLNDNGIWEEHLGEPLAITDGDGIADFGTVVSILDPGGDHPAGSGWQPARILTGNLRGTVGARDVRFDFVLPPGAGRATLGLHDLRGRRVAQVDGSGELTLPVPANLPSGVYIVRLSADPASAVTQRITSVGQRARTIRARQVSADEAIAAGWLESRAPATAGKSRDQAHPSTIMVAHVAHGGVNQAVTIVPGLNEFVIEMPVAPAGYAHIPAGSFLMGSPPDEPGREAHEGPRHLVTLTQAFYMAQHEVTAQRWYQVMGGTPTTSQLPRNYVSWDMAVEFCNALSLLEGLTPAYEILGPNGNVIWDRSADGYRLPTEAEWEYACRAATLAAYHNGTNCLSSDTEANFAGNVNQMPGCPTGVYRGARIAVGSFPPNPWGLFDMHGNLWEWTWCGWSRTYTEEPVVDPVHDVVPGAFRVVRGGSFYDIAEICRSAQRSDFSPVYEFNNYGFRPVRTIF